MGAVVAGKIHWNSVGVRLREIPTYHNSLVQLAEKQQRERELAQEAYTYIWLVRSFCTGEFTKKKKISWQARVSEIKCRFRGAGQQHTRSSKGEQLVLACLLASLFGFFFAKETNGKAKTKRERRTAAKAEKQQKQRAERQKHKKLKSNKSKKTAEAKKQQTLSFFGMSMRGVGMSMRGVGALGFLREGPRTSWILHRGVARAREGP